MRSLITKINLSTILKAHLSTLVDSSTKERKGSLGDKVLFFLAPAVVSALASLLFIPSDKNIIGILITSLSIFAGLLFNLLVLVMQIIEKRKGKTDFIRIQKDTYANIAYAILVSITASAILLIPYFIESTNARVTANGDVFITFYARVFWAVIYFLLLNFGLTMAMVLKRMHVILTKIMDYSD